MMLEVLNRNFTEITDDYRKFASEKASCTQCSIFDAYKQVGQSEGNAKNPDFMIIGEALGQDEVEQVRPFIGRAGQHLRAELRKYPNVFNKNTCLITNTIPCRPLNNSFPRDQDGPWQIRSNGARHSVVAKAKLVISHCAEKWLYREIGLVKPKVIITLGAQSLEYVRGERGITNCRGNWLFLNRFRAWSFATYHPSYVLRCANDPAKKHVVSEFESDFKKIAESWQQIVDSDDRMFMSDDDWKREQCFQFKVSKHLIKSRPIDETDHTISAWNNL